MQEPSTTKPPRFNAAQHKPRHLSLLRTDIRTAVLQELTLLQAKGLLVQALDELQRIDVDDTDLQQAEHLHHAFVQILHTAHALHATAATTLLEHTMHALRMQHRKACTTCWCAWVSTPIRCRRAARCCSATHHPPERRTSVKPGDSLANVLSTPHKKGSPPNGTHEQQHPC